MKMAGRALELVKRSMTSDPSTQDTPNNSSLRGLPMQALADSHVFVNELSPRQFLRACYMWKFNKDITDEALETDAKDYTEIGKVPPYVCEYLINVYGAN